MDTVVCDPIEDIPENLKPDGSNYVEWVWALLDDGIEVRPGHSFSSLQARHGDALLESRAAVFLDEQLVIATRAAALHGHDMRDVVMCCHAASIDSTAIADDLNCRYVSDPKAALARARAIAEICEVADEFCPEAIHLKWKLAGDDQLQEEVRRLFGPVP